MAFTAANLVTLETAIMDLTAGASMVQIGSRMYRKSSLKQLQDLYEWMQRKVDNSSNTGIVRGTFNKISDQDDN